MEKLYTPGSRAPLSRWRFPTARPSFDGEEACRRPCATSERVFFFLENLSLSQLSLNAKKDKESCEMFTAAAGGGLCDASAARSRPFLLVASPRLTARRSGKREVMSSCLAPDQTQTGRWMGGGEGRRVFGAAIITTPYHVNTSVVGQGRGRGRGDEGGGQSVATSADWQTLLCILLR